MPTQSEIFHGAENTESAIHRMARCPYLTREALLDNRRIWGISFRKILTDRGLEDDVTITFYKIRFSNL